MSTLSNEDFAGAFDHMSSLLVSQKVVQGEADEAALLKAMEKIAKRLAEADMQSKKPGSDRAITPDHFVGRTMGRMGECGVKCRARIEAQRKKQYNDVVSQLQDKPSIDPKSRKLAPSHKPLFQRASELLLKKKERLRELQYQQATEALKKDLENTAFRPNSSTGKSRTPQEFREQVLVWLHKRNTAVANLQREKQEHEDLMVTDRPVISQRSVALSCKVRLRQQDRSGGIAERLYRAGRQERTPPELPFRPMLSSGTRMMTQGRAKTPVHERLYSMGGKQEQRGTPTMRRDRSPAGSKSVDLSFEKTYKINLNAGLAGELKASKSNKIVYDSNLSFLWKTMGRK